jgi:MFS superfamily sulfate permease-like transporter
MVATVVTNLAIAVLLGIAVNWAYVQVTARKARAAARAAGADPANALQER